MTTTEKLVCNICGSDKVQYVAWIRANTGEFAEIYGQPDDIENNWCETCQEHPELIPESKYKQEQEKQ